MDECAASCLDPPAGRMAWCFSSGLRRSGAFCDLDQAGLAELERVTRTSTFPRGVAIYSEADPLRSVYCVCSGRVKLSRTSPDGRSVVFGIATPGDVLGVRPMLLGKPTDHAAEALEETRLCFIPKDAFMGLLTRNGGVGLRLAQKLSVELGEAYRQVCGLVFTPVAERLAELLFALCRTHGESTRGHVKLSIDISRDELAELVGVSRRSLSRALGTLTQRGLIACRRRAIIVHDRAALRKCLVSPR